jgi:hypothetical protein
MNGDGLPDLVLADGDGFRVLYNRSHPGLDPGQPLFSAAADEATNLTDLAVEGSKHWGVDIGVGVDAGAFGLDLGAGYSSSATQSRQILTDLDGDGFVDIVRSSGDSLRGTPCASGAGMCFTPTPFGAVASIDPGEDPALGKIADDVLRATNVPLPELKSA